MTGEAFRSMVGTIQRTHNPTTDEVEETIEHLDAFGEVADQLRVLARATPFDKAILVRGLKCLGKNVAVTGDGISDVEPLKISDVGLAMGSGCSAAINSADVVLTDDDFEATIQAIKWGRNIFHNVSRFLQFQVTVNISALLTVLIGGLFLG
jgi:P-type E1-E2 ATPase